MEARTLEYVKKRLIGGKLGLYEGNLGMERGMDVEEVKTKGWTREDLRRNG